jgi:hypothetical protein
MFNNVLSLIGQEQVEVFSKKTEIKENGAQSVKWFKSMNVFCNIQADNTYGRTLQASERGDNIQAVYNLYTKTALNIGDRVKRSNGVMFEIRNVEHNGVGTILEHYKAYITRLDK